MKKSIFGIFLICFALLSCSNDDDSLQKIDQILNMYFENSAGKDLLVPNKVGSFTTITMNDNLANTDIAPVSFTMKQDDKSTYYLQYIDGATRELVSGGDSDDRIYHSEIRVLLTKKLTDSTYSTPTSDTLDIFYHWTPRVFEVSKVYYNKELKFTKDSQVTNVVTIVK